MARPTKAGTPTPAKVARNLSSQTTVKKSNDYTSEGVEDNDVFLLPGSDYQIMVGVTFLAAVVRLFRIYQPSSVVFDEVQYVPARSRTSGQWLTSAQLWWIRIEIY